MFSPVAVNPLVAMAAFLLSLQTVVWGWGEEAQVCSGPVLK